MRAAAHKALNDMQRPACCCLQRLIQSLLETFHQQIDFLDLNQQRRQETHHRTMAPTQLRNDTQVQALLLYGFGQYRVGRRYTTAVSGSDYFPPTTKPRPRTSPMHG